MGRGALRLAIPARTRGPRGRRIPLLLALAVLAAGLAATLAGAGRARVPFDAVAIAEGGLVASLGGEGAGAERARSSLRARLADCPLDATTRAAYASLLAETALSEQDRSAASAEGRRAARSAPHDAGVRRAAVKIMARTGDQGGAVTAIRTIFVDAPEDAARVLSEIEPFLSEDRVEAAIPELADAWLARARSLRDAGRTEEADWWLDAACVRWPDDLRARRIAAAIAAGRGDLLALLRLVPPGLAIPEDSGHAALVALRARSRAVTGDPEGARRDTQLALRLSPRDPSVLTASGDAVEGIDPALARSYWTAAIFAHGHDERTRPSRVRVLARVARLDEREGRAGDALRRWREIVRLDPEHAEANRRIAALTN